jgi:hypothetical protein
MKETCVVEIDRSTKTYKAAVIAYEKCFRVTESGDFYGTKGKKNLTLRKGQRYPSFAITIYPKETVTVNVHKFAAYCFYGDKAFQKGMQVRHINGDVLDISKKNIKMGTPRENVLDIPDEIRKRTTMIACKASLPVQRFFSDDEVRNMRFMRNEQKIKFKDLALLFGDVDPSTVRKICNRQRYRDVI